MFGDISLSEFAAFVGLLTWPLCNLHNIKMCGSFAIWVLLVEVLERPQEAERENWWRTMKEEVDVAIGRTWTGSEWSRGAWHARVTNLRGRQTCSQGCHRLAG